MLLALQINANLAISKPLIAWYNDSSGSVIQAVSLQWVLNCKLPNSFSWGDTFIQLMCAMIAPQNPGKSLIASYRNFLDETLIFSATTHVPILPGSHCRTVTIGHTQLTSILLSVWCSPGWQRHTLLTDHHQWPDLNHSRGHHMDVTCVDTSERSRCWGGHRDFLYSPQYTFIS